MEDLHVAGLRPLIGREVECVELRRRVASERLVTITGPGGIGKTRLALAVLGQLPGTATTAQLSALSDPEHVAGAILTEIGARPESGVAAEQTLVARLSDGEVLLLLDNCEHLRAAVAALCGRLLVAVPSLRILATSQVALGTPGEVVFELAPLSLGAGGDAVCLFVDRARRCSRGFSADAAALERIAGLCAELDGLPLAIELAAARTRILDLEQIAVELGRRLDLLAGGSVEHPRHRSLRASMDWSCSHLTEPERALFERCSVFVGGWDLAAAEAICARPPVDRSSVLDLLGALVERGLVVVDRSGGRARFGMLATVRAYASERLRAAGETDRVVAAHAAWFARLVEEEELSLLGRDQARALARLDRESDNVRAALAWATVSDSPTALGIAAGSAIYWHIRGRFAEGRRALEPLRSAARDSEPELRARLLWALGLMLVASGELAAARPIVQEAVGRARDLDQPRLQARALVLLGELDLMAAPDAAEGPLAEAVALARRAGDPWCLSDALGKLGAGALYQSRATEAKAPLRESLEIARVAGDERTIHRALGGLARVTAIEGDAQGALELLRESLSISERLGDRSWIALDLAVLGELERFAGRASAGRPLAERGLALAEEIDAGYPRYVATGVLGRISLALGDHDAAARRFDGAVTLARREGWRPFRSWWELGLADLALQRGELSVARTAAQAALASAETIGNRRDAGRATALLGLVAQARDEHQVAIAQLTAALSIHHEVDDEPAARRALAALVQAFAAAGQADRARRLAAALARQDGGLDEARRLALRGRGARSRERVGGWGGLTRAEADVAELAAQGASNPDIARRLFMSRSTVKSHLSRVYAKLEVANRTELAGALVELRDSDGPDADRRGRR